MTASAGSELQAALLAPIDDVATALRDLPAGVAVRVECGGVVRETRLAEGIRTGHKFAVRDLAPGLRIRKYGECIGRTTRAVAAGEWVHEHNLATSARREHTDRVLADAASPPVVRTLGEARTSVGESPVFDATTNRFYWIDVRDTPAIHRLDVGAGTQMSWPMTEDVGSIDLAGRDRLLVALRSGFAFFDVATGALRPILDPESALPSNRMNDGKCDAAGRFWCASMNPESGTADGSLYVLDEHLQCRRVLGDLVTPNGIAWNLAGDVMYLADTRRAFIYAFPFDAATGALGERRVFADLGGLPGGPDGAAVDTDDHLWSAQFDGGCLVRYDPKGRVDRVVRLPVTRPASCAFGGPGYRQLFVTTATRGLSPEALRGEPLAGRVLVLDVDVAGLAPIGFGHASRAAEAA
jgi:sugar lactone lactonase YvrE